MIYTIKQAIESLKECMEANAIDRVTVSDHGTLVKISYTGFLAMFGTRTDYTRLGSEIRFHEDGVTFCSEVVRDQGVKIEEGAEV